MLLPDVYRYVMPDTTECYRYLVALRVAWY